MWFTNPNTQCQKTHMQLFHVVAESEHSTCHNPNAPCTTVDNMASVASQFHIRFLHCKMAGKCTQWFLFLFLFGSSLSPWALVILLIVSTTAVLSSARHLFLLDRLCTGSFVRFLFSDFENWSFQENPSKNPSRSSKTWAIGNASCCGQCSSLPA